MSAGVGKFLAQATLTFLASHLGLETPTTGVFKSRIESEALIAIGGAKHPRSIEVFSPNCGGGSVVSYELPTLFCHRDHAAALVKNGHRILITGGYDCDSGKITARSWLFNTRTLRRREIPPTQVARRGAQAVSLANGNVLVCGGLTWDAVTQGEVCEQSCELLNTVNQWKVASTMLRCPDGSFHMVVSDNYVYLIHRLQIDQYEIVNDEWTILKQLHEGLAPMPTTSYANIDTDRNVTSVDWHSAALVPSFLSGSVQNNDTTMKRACLQGQLGCLDLLVACGTKAATNWAGDETTCIEINLLRKTTQEFTGFISSLKPLSMEYRYFTIDFSLYRADFERYSRYSYHTLDPGTTPNAVWRYRGLGRWEPTGHHLIRHRYAGSFTTIPCSKVYRKRKTGKTQHQQKITERSFSLRDIIKEFDP